MTGKRIAAFFAALLLLIACSSCSEQGEYVFVVENSDSESRSEDSAEDTALELSDATEVNDLTDDKKEDIPSSASESDTEKPSGMVDTVSENPEETSAMTSESIAETIETTTGSKETTAETTKKEQETSVPATSESESKAPDNIVLSVISLTETVSRGNTAKLVVSGEPGVEYTIKVYYSSGASTAKGLEAHTADDSGLVTWEWRVGSRTKAGSHRIVVSGGGNTITLYFTTTE